MCACILEGQGRCTATTMRLMALSLPCNLLLITSCELQDGYRKRKKSLNELLVERGREFIFEGKRRTDLIRFDRFTTGSWWDKTPDGDDHTELYPIPYRQVQTNPNIEQNPGY